MAYQYKISTVSQADLKLLSYYNIAVPDDDFTPWKEEDQLGNGGVRVMGLADCIWHWGFLPAAMYTILRASPLLTVVSGLIWIRTSDEDGNWHDYSGRYFLPKRRFSAGRAIDVSLQLRALVKLTDL